jgi:hypothetical protein
MAKKVYNSPYPTSERQRMEGIMVAVMNLKMDEWNNELIEPRSQAIKKTEIHELVVTSQIGVGPGDMVTAAAFLGFFEVTLGGLLVTGDAVKIGGRDIGKVVGFNTIHMPNHLNVVIQVSDLNHGEGLGLHVGQPVVLSPGK